MYWLLIFLDAISHGLFELIPLPYGTSLIWTYNTISVRLSCYPIDEINLHFIGHFYNVSVIFPLLPTVWYIMILKKHIYKVFKKTRATIVSLKYSLSEKFSHNLSRRESILQVTEKRKFNYPLKNNIYHARDWMQTIRTAFTNKQAAVCLKWMKGRGPFER